MPNYDFECGFCGPFTVSRPMALSGDPCECPACGDEAPRAYLRAPQLLGMDAARRTAFATNEKSSHEPRFSATGVNKGQEGKGHGAGCSCCSTGKSKKTLYRPDGAKAFPSSRPWMISH